MEENSEQNYYEYIKKALDYYDEQILKYNNLIISKNIKISEKINEDNEIIFYDEDNKIAYDSTFEVLGYFDSSTRVWVWGWLMQGFKNEDTKISKDLLNYGLKLEPSTKYIDLEMMIKALLVNSRIRIGEDIQLTINLAICCKIVRERFKFIYPKKVYTDTTKKNYITFYLLVK